MFKNQVVKTMLAGLAVFIFAASSAVAGGGITLSQDVQGSIASVQTDIDGDGGTTASIGAFAGTGSPGGAFTVQTLSELSTIPGDGSNCGPGEVEFPLVAFSAVERIDAGNALIYFTLDPVAGGFSCANPVTGALTGTANFLIIGGTGILTGATGTAVLDFSGAAVAVDSTGGAVQTALTGSIEGNIVLP